MTTRAFFSATEKDKSGWDKMSSFSLRNMIKLSAKQRERILLCGEANLSS